MREGTLQNTDGEDGEDLAVAFKRIRSERMGSFMNPLLEVRLESLQDSLDKLSMTVDENLRSVLFSLTCDTTVAHIPLKDISVLAQKSRERCLLLVAREHPLANDLKYAMAALRVGHDYERIHELSVSLHKRVDLLRGTPMQDVVQDMTGIMADILKLHEIVRHTWQRDRRDQSTPALKPQVSAIVSTIYSRIAAIQNKIMELIAKGGGSPEMFVELVLACRHIKRIANTMEAIPDELHAFDKRD